MVKVKSYEDNSTETEGKTTIYLLYVSVPQLPCEQIQSQCFDLPDKLKETLLARYSSVYTQDAETASEQVNTERIFRN